LYNFKIRRVKDGDFELLWAHHAIRIRIRKRAFGHHFKNTIIAKLASQSSEKTERGAHRP
jgi:hypothetical protein